MLKKFFLFWFFFFDNLYGFSGKEPWQKYVLLPRSEHNFSLSVQNSSMKSLIQDQPSYSNHVYQTFQYTFFIPSWKIFTFLLGSNTSLGLYTKSFNPSYRFPGFIVGLSADFSSYLRGGCHFNYAFEKFSHLSFQNQEQTLYIKPIIETYDYLFFLDWFYQLNWALRLEYGLRFSESHFSVDILSGDISMIQEGSFFGVGLVYHVI